MKTTVDLPDELVIEAKKLAAESRTTLRSLIERGLRKELTDTARAPDREIQWVTSDGGLPPGMDVSNRESMYEFFEREDDRS